MKKHFLLLLMTLMPLASFAQLDVVLTGTTQYDTDGFKYDILSCTGAGTAAKGTVKVYQNVYATAGDADMVIKDVVALNVKGKNDAGVSIDQTVNFTVTEIADDAFNGLRNVKTVKIGKNVTTIGATAFKGCSEITSVTIGSGVTTIKANAFENCSKLNAVTFEANTHNVTIADNVFKNTVIKELDLSPITGTLAAVNKWFDNSAFVADLDKEVAANNKFRRSLEKITFPAKVTSIVEDAFAGFWNLKEVVFTAATTGSTTIGAGAFKETAIVDLDLTNARITDLERLFQKDNTTLKTVKMSKTVETLKENALADCIQLNSVDFSQSNALKSLKKGSLSNTVVPSYDFSNCYTVTKISGVITGYNTILNFEDSQNPFVNSTTTTNKNLVTVTLPYESTTLKYSGVDNIGTVFADCEKLTTITHLEDSKVAVVKDGAFANDKALTALTFPTSVTNVNVAPFAGCENLAELTFQGNATIGDGTNALFGTTNDALTTLTIKAVGSPLASAATIKANALSANTAITKVEIAKGGTFNGTIEAAALTLAADQNSTVEFGNIGAAAVLNSIEGPSGTYAATLTLGNYAATGAPAAIVSNNVATATVKAVSTANVLVAIGFAETIEFTGNITAATLAVPAANDRLTTILFNSIVIPAAAIVAGTFDETNAPNLKDVTWNPAAAVKAFDQAAFGAASVGAAAAKVTLHTSTAVATLYDFDEGELFNVKFDALPPAPPYPLLSTSTRWVTQVLLSTMASTLTTIPTPYTSRRSRMARPLLSTLHSLTLPTRPST